MFDSNMYDDTHARPSSYIRVLGMISVIFPSPETGEAIRRSMMQVARLG